MAALAELTAAILLLSSSDNFLEKFDWSDPLKGVKGSLKLCILQCAHLGIPPPPHSQKELEATGSSRLPRGNEAASILAHGFQPVTCQCTSPLLQIVPSAPSSSESFGQTASASTRSAQSENRALELQRRRGDNAVKSEDYLDLVGMDDERGEGGDRGYESFRSSRIPSHQDSPSKRMTMAARRESAMSTQSSQSGRSPAVIQGPSSLSFPEKPSNLRETPHAAALSGPRFHQNGMAGGDAMPTSAGAVQGTRPVAVPEEAVQAVTDADIQTLDLLVENGTLVDVNGEDSRGDTLLCIAVKHNKFKSVLWLCNNRANVRQRGRDNYLPVGMSNDLGHRGLSKFLGIWSDIAESCPLHLAALQGDETSLSAAISANPGGVDAPEPFGQHAPLHLAVKQQHFKCTQLLIQAKANLNLKHPLSQETPLATAVLLRNDALIMVLLQHGALPSHHLGKPLTSWAADRGCSNRVMDILLSLPSQQLLNAQSPAPDDETFPLDKAASGEKSRGIMVMLRMHHVCATSSRLCTATSS